MGAVHAAWWWFAARAPEFEAFFIGLSAIAGFLVIRHTGRISRMESTIEMVRQTFFEEAPRASYKKFKELFITLKADGKSIADLAKPDLEQSDEVAVLLRQLNNYELVSLGIKKGVFDERFYKRWFYSQLTSDFERLTPFIEAVRTQAKNQAYWCEFTELADRWHRKKHPVKHPPKWRLIWWMLLGQHDRTRRALDTTG